MNYFNMIRCLAVIVVCMFVRLHCAPVASDCQNLTPDQEQQFLSATNITTTFNMFLPDELTGQPNGPTSLQEVMVQSQTLYSTHCPTTLPSAPDTPIYARSSCPWFINIDHDPERYPASIPYAVPRCSQFDSCVGISDDQKANFVCERVYMPIRVLRRVQCSEGLYKWEERTERIAVDTTCARVKEVQSSTSSDGGPPLGI